MSRKINLRKAIIKGIFGIILGPILGAIAALTVDIALELPAGNKVFSLLFYGVWLATVALFVIWGARSKTKEEELAEARKHIVSDVGLAKNEKIIAWVFSVINPVITGAVLYYMWRKTHPTKAREANRISILVFLIEGILVLLISLALGGN